MLDQPRGKGPLDSSYNSTDYIYIEWVYGREGDLWEHFNPTNTIKCISVPWEYSPQNNSFTLTIIVFILMIVRPVHARKLPSLILQLDSQGGQEKFAIKETWMGSFPQSFYVTNSQ
jgi:hypothetical protein